MPRNKGQTQIRKASFQHEPSRLQDGTGFLARASTVIIGDISTTIIENLSERVTIIEAITDALALSRGTVYELTVPLVRGQHGGTVDVDLPLPVVDEALDRPLLVNQAPRGDVDEAGIIAFTGQVIASRKVRLHWHSHEPAPAVVNVVFLIA